VSNPLFFIVINVRLIGTGSLQSIQVWPAVQTVTVKKWFLSSSEVKVSPRGRRPPGSAAPWEGKIFHCHRGQQATINKQMHAKDIN